MLDASASAMIGVYQRYVSPYKGFCCAYRVHTKRRSCSAYAKSIIDRLGAMALFAAMPRQFARCKAACLALVASRSAAELPSEEQREKRPWWERCDCNPLDCLDLSQLSCDVPCDCSF
ncbi:membrane protein insertion efficiency factor YidD [Variovorax rhizosphaerae]|uniref:Membrane protein insertion efficiency factor YidD n=1 Tax=Variovorax rhizosphaerae TaxID=1836200 RepID=A0ABU8WUQ4_9BURK